MDTNADSIFAAIPQDLHPQQSPPSANPTYPHRRPRGFAATNSSSNNAIASTAASSASASASAKNRTEREKEKERTKLRERHRRAITSRMLAGLRQYGNFPLPARADMNDVIAALAREAGWTVEADGTTYKQSSAAQTQTQPQPQLRPQPPPMCHFNSIQQNNSNVSNVAAYPVGSVESPIYSSSQKNCSWRSSVDCQPSTLRVDEDLSPASFDSVAVGADGKLDKYSSASAINSSECLEADQLMHDSHCNEHGSGPYGTCYVPVSVRLGTGLITSFCQLMDPEGIKEELQHLKSLHVDGVVVDCWWGIVEAWTPKNYEWAGYREVFDIIREYGMKLQVIMCFHEYGGHDSGGTFISLPEWIMEIGRSNQDIFFTDREGRRNTECLSWGIDKERVLSGRTGLEVYYDFMRSFRIEFDDLFADGLISAVEIGLGPSGELRYPSFSERMGWRYPGLGEFQCYDKYLMQNLGKAAKLRGHSVWARGPDNAGCYNSKPCETGFFCEHGDFDSYYGRFFLHWYSQVLIDHADNVLSLACLAFTEVPIVVKIPAIYWWYKTTSHAAELTAGYYNPSNRDGYSRLFQMLKKHGATMKLVIPGVQTSYQDINEAFSDPDGLNWQVLNSAWDQGLDVAGQNAHPCYDRGDLMKLVATARPRNHPDCSHFSFFAYQQPSPLIQRTICFSEIDYFIKSMHGDTGS